MAGEIPIEGEPTSPHGDMQDWGDGRWMARLVLDERWVQYMPVNADGSRIIDADGTPRRGVAIRRRPVFSAEFLAEMDAKYEAEEGRAEAI